MMGVEVVKVDGWWGFSLRRMRGGITVWAKLKCEMQLQRFDLDGGR